MSQESLKDKVIGKLQKEYIGIEKRTDITDDECIAKFYPIAYDECMKDFKDFTHTQGLSWE